MREGHAGDHRRVEAVPCVELGWVAGTRPATVVLRRVEPTLGTSVPPLHAGHSHPKGERNSSASPRAAARAPRQRALYQRGGSADLRRCLRNAASSRGRWILTSLSLE